jgi:hypothetical protein
MDLNLETPDHTTVSRRSQQLNVDLRHAAEDGPIHLITDSTGLSIVGEGEWAAVKHGAAASALGRNSISVLIDLVSSSPRP